MSTYQKKDDMSNRNIPGTPVRPEDIKNDEKSDNGFRNGSRKVHEALVCDMYKFTKGQQLKDSSRQSNKSLYDLEQKGKDLEALNIEQDDKEIEQLIRKYVTRMEQVIEETKKKLSKNTNIFNNTRLYHDLLVADGNIEELKRKSIVSNVLGTQCFVDAAFRVIDVDTTEGQTVITLLSAIRPNRVPIFAVILKKAKLADLEREQPNSEVMSSFIKYLTAGVEKR